MIPQGATAEINFRRLPGVSAEDVVDRVRRVIDDPGVEVRVGLNFDAPEPAEVDSPWFRAIARAVREVHPDAVVVPGLLPGGTDSRHYAPVTGDIYRFLGFAIPIRDMDRMHGTDERTNVESYADGIRVLARMLQVMGSANGG